MSASSEPELFDDRYELREALGEGATATVWRAWDTVEGVERAVKILSPALQVHEAMRERFQLEADITAGLRHPNIVTVHHSGLNGARFYIVMDLVRGGTLKERIDRRGRLHPRHAASIVQQALHALHYAHAEGVVHRDINTHNLMLTQDGTPKLVDFGLGRMLGRRLRHADEVGTALGTRGYMAPEQQIDSGHVDNRTDIYAAGATLYAIVRGRRPDKLYEAQEADFEGVPASLVDVIRTACRYQPDERYQTAAEMARALATAHDALPQLRPEEEATIVVKPAAPDDTVLRKRINLANIVPPEEVNAERKRRRALARAERKRSEEKTNVMSRREAARLRKELDARRKQDEARKAQAAEVAATTTRRRRTTSLVLALGLLVAAVALLLMRLAGRG